MGYARFNTLMLGVATAALYAPDASAQVTGENAIEEVVVTASRRADTVHNVAMSIAAVTTETIEAQGLKTVQDLARTVPAVQIPIPILAGGAANVSIRGVRSTAGAATTGIYIDDVPLQQRSLIAPTGGGVAFPQLFDLERVEVLRGPQGTLYGGSSQGGTLRFITRQPNFKRHSAYLRGEAATTEGGDASYEAGASVGGPIIADKLAFHLTAWARKDGGYIDHISRFSGKSVGDNTNSQLHHLAHLQVAWRPVERAKVTLSYFYSDNKVRDGDVFWENVPRYQANVGPVTPTAPQGTFFTYGPYDFYGPGKSGFNTLVGDQFYTSDAQIQPLYQTHENYTRLPSLTLDYDFDTISVKSVTSLLDLENHTNTNFAYIDIAGRGGTPFYMSPGGVFFNALPAKSSLIANLPYYNSPFDQNGTSRVFTEELRFSSTNLDSRLRWVAGIYFSHNKMKTRATVESNFPDVLNAINLGLSTRTPSSRVYITQQRASETQLAAFGEATYSITDRLRATAGVRWTRNSFDFVLFQGGSLFGLPYDPALSAQGSVTESPVTPKFGLQYIINDNNNVYVSAAKGFRPGGVNQPLGPTCGPALAAAGLTSPPLTFDSDSIWSYEGGAKLRGLGGRATLNSSVFRIDWSGVQTNLFLTCGQSFTANASKVVSKGFDVDASVRVLPGLTLSGALAYTDARYRGNVQAAGGGPLIAADGDRMPYTSKWSGSFSGQFDFRAASLPAYIRADYQFQSGFVLGSGPTTFNHAPDQYTLNGNDFLSARAGLTVKKVDISVFVNNLANSQDRLASLGFAGAAGRNNCIDLPACTRYVGFQPANTAVTFRPRTWGIAASYRY